jgi:hypothetical protein
MTAPSRRLSARSAPSVFPRWHRRTASSRRARQRAAEKREQGSALTLEEVGVLGVEHGLPGMLRRAAEARARGISTTSSGA